MSELLNNRIIAPLVGLIEIGILFRVVQKLMAAQSEEGTLKVAIKSCKKLMIASVIAISLPSVIEVIKSFFSGNIFDGARTVLYNATSAFIFIEIVYLTFLEICEGLQYQAAQAEEQATHKKKMVEMLIVGIVIITATGVLPAIWRYF